MSKYKNPQVFVDDFLEWYFEDDDNSTKISWANKMIKTLNNQREFKVTVQSILDECGYVPARITDKPDTLNDDNEEYEFDANEIELVYNYSNDELSLVRVTRPEDKEEREDDMCIKHQANEYIKAFEEELKKCDNNLETYWVMIESESVDINRLVLLRIVKTYLDAGWKNVTCVKKGKIPVNQDKLKPHIELTLHRN